MSEFFVAIAWGLTVLGAFWGWGWMLGRMLGKGRGAEAESFRPTDFLEAPVWGVAVSVVAGGVLNLFAISNRSVACGYVGCGALLAVFPRLKLWGNRRAAWKAVRADPPGLVILMAVILLLCLRLGGSVIVPSYNPGPAWRGVQFNPHDDMHSYLVSVERLLQTGTLGSDPFNSRQMANALGGEHFLNEMMIAAIPVDHIHMLEEGLGLVVLCLAAGAMGLRLGGGRAAVVMVLVPLVIRWPFVNISSTVTTAALLTGLLVTIDRIMEERGRGKTARGGMVLAGILLGAVCALKTTTIPVACFAVAAMFVFQTVISRKVRYIGDGLMVGVVALAVMTPWMVWQYRASGTLLYPLLGKGDYIDAYYHWPSPTMAMGDKVAAGAGIVVPLLLLMVLGTGICFRNIRSKIGKTVAVIGVAYLMAWIVEWVVMVQATEMPDVSRYVASAGAVGILLFFAMVWRMGYAKVTGIVFAGILLWHIGDWITVYFEELPDNVHASMNGRLMDWKGQAATMQKMQGVVPAGEKMLVYLDRPALLNFRRNAVYVVDWPGESSAAPGMPVWADEEAVARYLVGQNIRYVCYSYRDQANVPREAFGMYVSAAFGRIISRQAAESFKFQDMLGEMRREHRVVFDDGAIFVVDLTLPAKGAVTGR